MQGLAFWIGWSHERFPFWPLSEGAMVAEAQAAIAARLGPGLSAIAEVPTKSLVSEQEHRSHKIRSGRIDLVVIAKRGGSLPKGEEIRDAALALVEIKRGQAPWSEIKKDLVRLANILATMHTGCRAFLIIGCERGQSPSRFIYQGAALRGKYVIDGGYYRTRRVWRASSARNVGKTSHAVALVEVFAGAP